MADATSTSITTTINGTIYDPVIKESVINGVSLPVFVEFLGVCGFVY
jgi:hypothetical protein